MRPKRTMRNAASAPAPRTARYSLRRRAFTAAGALTLIAFSAFSGALSAAAEIPGQPVMDSPAANAIQFNPGIFPSGTILAASVTIEVQVHNYDPETNTTDLLCSATLAPLETAWACSGILRAGYNQLTALAYDPAIPTDVSTASPMVQIIKASTLPPAGISSPSNLDVITDRTPTFSGPGPVMGFVDVIVGAETTLCLNVPVGSDGAWSCTVLVPMAYGTYADLRLTTRYANDTLGPVSGSQSLTIQPEKPALSYTFSSAQARVTGVGEASGGVSIELYSAEPAAGGYDYTLAAGCPTLIDMLNFGHVRAFGASTEVCSFSSLAPGVWNVYSGQRVDGQSSAMQSDFFRVPSTPTISARVNANRTVTLSGIANSGELVHVQTSAYAGVCDVVASANTWSCTISPPSGLRSYVAFAEDQGFAADTGEGEPADNSYQGHSAYTAPVSARVPRITPAAIPVVEQPKEWGITLSGDGSYDPGDTVIVTGTNAPSGATVKFELHSTPTALGSVVADVDGSFRMRLTIPEDAEPGAHTIVAILASSTGEAGTGAAGTQIEKPVTVREPVAVVPAEEVKTPSAPADSGAPTVPEQLGAPPILASGLISPLEILTNPLVVATAGSVGLALVLLVFVPAEFFGEALAGHYRTLAGAVGRRRRLGEFFSRIGAWIATHRVLTSVALVLATSAVFSFVDPNFGADLTSVRLIMSCAIAILLVNFASAGITEIVAGRFWHIATRLTVMPWGLLAAILGVISSRVLNFAPGFLLGSIIGVSIIGEVTKRVEARVVVLWSTVVWSIAVGAWLLGGLVPVLPSDHPMAFFAALAGDALAATTAAGLTALVVALLPIALFDGGELFAYSKVQWAIAFGIAIASFSLVIVPSAGNWLELGEGLRNWLILTVSFSVLAIIVYLLARRSTHGRRSRLMGGHVS